MSVTGTCDGVEHVGPRTRGWWVDPVGAIVISLYIVYRWIDLCRSQVRACLLKTR